MAIHNFNSVTYLYIIREPEIKIIKLIEKENKKMSKKSKSEKNFFMRHKVMTIIGAVVVAGIIASAGGE